MAGRRIHLRGARDQVRHRPRLGISGIRGRIYLCCHQGNIPGQTKMTLNPYVWLGGLLVIVLCFGTGYISGRQDGQKITAAKYEAAQRKADAQVATTLAAAQDRVNMIQQASQQAMIEASQTYQKELQNVTRIKNKTISDLRAGAVRLRDTGTRYTIGPDPMSNAATGSGGCNGSPGGQLSIETSEFIVGLAAEADDIVHQLDACQQIIIEDRKAINE